jgi:hypothetical protein
MTLPPSRDPAGPSSWREAFDEDDDMGKANWNGSILGSGRIAVAEGDVAS